MAERPARLEIVLAPIQCQAARVWSVLVRVLGLDSGLIGMLEGKPVRLGDVALRLKDKGWFNFIADHAELNLNYNAECHFSRLLVECGWRKLNDCADCLLAGIGDIGSVRQAGLFDVEYDLRQRSEDILIFEAHGWPHAHLKKVSNGLPPPLTQLVVDTSENPGRYVFRDGYCEFVSNPIWLGPEFFEMRRLRPQDLKLGNPWTMQTRGDLIRITCQEAPFRSAIGEEARRQDELRAALYA